MSQIGYTSYEPEYTGERGEPNAREAKDAQGAEGSQERPPAQRIEVLRSPFEADVEDCGEAYEEEDVFTNREDGSRKFQRCGFDVAPKPA